MVPVPTPVGTGSVGLDFTCSCLHRIILAANTAEGVNGMNVERIERAFLAAGIDPEFSSVINAYQTNPYVHRLVHTLAEALERIDELSNRVYRSDEWLP